MNLILEMLLLLEDMPVPVGSGVLLKRGAEEIAVPGFSLDQIKFHFSLLRNAGFIDVVTIEPTTGLRFKGLTWAGHDFLDRARQREASDNMDAANEMDPDLMPMSPYGAQRRARAPQGAEAPRFYPRKSLRHRA
ncbi:MAG: DUF2513 domain-containing protein [Methylocystis sp.]